MCCRNARVLPCQHQQQVLKIIFREYCHGPLDAEPAIEQRLRAATGSARCADKGIMSGALRETAEAEVRSNDSLKRTGAPAAYIC